MRAAFHLEIMKGNYFSLFENVQKRQRSFLDFIQKSRYIVLELIETKDIFDDLMNLTCLLVWL